MKKFILSSVIVAAASGAFAQGLVTFANNSAAGSHVSINSAPGGAATAQIVGVGAYYFEFFYSLTSVGTANGSSAAVIPPSTAVTSLANTFGTSAAGFTDSGLSAAGTASAGRVQGTASASIAAMTPGSTYTGFIIGWSSNIGTTIGALESFLNAPQTTIGGLATYVGESPVGTFTAGSASVPVPNLLATSPAIPGFTLGQVLAAPSPEPSSIALAALGGLSLLGLRRKKA